MSNVTARPALFARQPWLLLTGLSLLAMFALVLALVSGSVSISLADLGTLLWQAPQSSDAQMNTQILRELRLPRALAAFVTGAMLALSGVMMQVLLRNPLADPYILGISGGSAAGALLVITLGVSGIWITQAAFVGALFSVLLVFGLAGRQFNWSATRLLLTGVVIASGWGALINIMLSTSTSQNVQSMLFWLMGDLSLSRSSVWHYLVLLGVLLFMLLQARPLNAMARGDLQAAALGVNVKRLRLGLYFCAALLTATAVTIAGTVGFVGLVVPHMLRLIGARNHYLLLPASALLGGSFLLLADSLARTVMAPQQLPVGVLTASLGVPVFLLILHHNARRQSTTGLEAVS
jgi:iron complex transport system permease protein